jgi:hypothetical protein
MDMNQCKPGDKLLLRNGTIGTYIRITGEKTYSHYIHHPQCVSSYDYTSVTDNGHCFIAIDNKYFIYHPFDVVGFSQKDEAEGEDVNIILIDNVVDKIKKELNVRVIGPDIKELIKKVPVESLENYLK